MFLNAITDYARPARYPTVWLYDQSKRLVGGRNESADLYRTGRSSIPQHKIDTLSGHLSIDRLWTVRELSVEVGLTISHQTLWHILKKWRMLGRSVDLINKQHLANGILRLSDIRQKVQNFARDYIEGL
ncbi:hypothetical protein AVEN_14995-1 [Araneus ventricosus]|uniref:Transposase Tc1-like domain-containing protein n=1 Tax=Araneus ventricosus TaxID=182803 RepID=A0A4Y2W9V5_ARAVE|nr:hypothetical protein AVEN_14995-1 [Araneus ventricosus]